MKSLRETTGLRSEDSRVGIIQKILKEFAWELEGRELLKRSLLGSATHGINVKGIQNCLIEMLHDPQSGLRAVHQICYEESFFGHYIEERDYSKVRKNLNPWDELRTYQLPYQSMLARSLDNTEQIRQQVLKFSDECLVEYKLDGERVQINYDRFRS